MVEHIFDIVGLDPSTNRIKLHNSIILSEKRIYNNYNTEHRNQSFHYRLEVGCLSYILAMIRPDITMAVQKYTIFYINLTKATKNQ